MDKAKKGRTTIVIAHRLSTVRHSDKIVAVREGRVEEEGTHDELMSLEGLYHSLVTTQMAGKEEELEDKVERVTEEEVVMVTSDALENLNLEDAEMPSLMSIGSFSETFEIGRASCRERV